MDGRPLAVLATAATLLTAVACTPGRAEFRPTFAEVGCPDDVTAVMLETPTCGYLTVLQRRDRPRGRTIRLFVVRVDPPGEPSPDPMVLVGDYGGLGNRIEYGSNPAMAVRTHRRLYMLDQRGTGRSEPNLSCPEVREKVPTLLRLRQSDPQHSIVLLDGVQACHDRLTRAGVDLEAYNLTESAADVADLRTALHLDEINVIAFGTSSRIAVEAVRRFPHGIRTAVLDSPDLPGSGNPVRAPAQIEDALTAVGRTCARANNCRGVGADVVSALREAVRRLDRRPAAVTVNLAGGPVTVAFDGALLVRTVRALITSNGGRDLPDALQLIAQARSGQPFTPNPIATARLAGEEALCLGYLPVCEGRLTHGLYYAVLCHDIVPFVTPAEADPGIPDGYAVAYRRNPFREVCRIWHAGQADPSTAEPIASDIPVLIEVAVYDPYSRAREVKRLSAGLTRVQVIEIPNHSYNVFGYYECPRDIRGAWLDNPKTAPADTSCLTKLHDPLS
jgi:pimeloyl-ACP methyl ester carboxylesterase